MTKKKLGASDKTTLRGPDDDLLIMRKNSSPFHSEVSIPGGVLLETEMLSPLEQLRQRWENLNKDQSTKLQLSLNTLEQDQLSPVQMTCTLWILFPICLCLI